MLEMVAAATKNFLSECLLGEGGFGIVYKGYLENLEQEWIEVMMLSLLHHENLVKLIGYCADGAQRLLVFGYMSLGSLEDHLLDIPPEQKPLSWLVDEDENSI
ncbi:hypothetical protein ZIOFF_058142 [Zingiber officinale]|uniref:Protein kinase domain-containing protein n=1 Tax=Zingiber officinale TaxID=94328 RepID=A0A8J5F7J8_ZINOF|nr:hypothetical protein ZIOFF_058142 [Zingiber officinale]